VDVGMCRFSNDIGDGRIFVGEGIEEMSAMVEFGLFTSYKVGWEEHIHNSHLQFADDTLIFGDKSWTSGCSMQVDLILFEAISGLTINFNKSMLMDVNVTDSWLAEAVMVMNFKTEKIPFVYLGLHYGIDVESY
jgi:hypothetical protein